MSIVSLVTKPAVFRLTHANIMEMAALAAATIKVARGDRPLKLYAIPRGGIPAAYAILAHLHPATLLTDEVVEADVIVDDLIDSGNTMERYVALNPDALPVVLLDKSLDHSPFKNHWMIFPWEGNEEGSANDIPMRLLQFIGEDPTRGGLKDTPGRFLRAWQSYTAGYKEDPATILKCFEDGAEKYDELVLVKDIPVYSHCEHHLAPFFGVAHVGYIPNGKIVGLSKLSRLVDIFARRLQVQERLTSQIAHALQEHLKPLAVGVILECRHMCMEARGIQRQGAMTKTSAMLGSFREKPEARAEFLELVR